MLKIDFHNYIISGDYEEISRRVQGKEKFRDKSVYITGASGMIASYITGFLIWLNENYDYRIQIYAGIRKREKAYARFGRYADSQYFHLIDRDVTEPVPKECRFDYLIHAASLASPQYYGNYPAETMLPNVIGTYHLLEYAKKHPVEGMLFFSSGGVYGNISNTADAGIDEEQTGILTYLDSGCRYAESKRCGEAMCVSYAQEFHVPVMIARITHTFGPTLDITGDRRVFSEFVGNIVNHQDIVIKSDGSAVRQFCYITDTVTGLLTILLHGGHGIPYNIGNDRECHSIEDLARILVNLYPERKLAVKYQPRNDEGYVSQPKTNWTYISVNRLRMLGWQPVHSVSDGFKRTIEAIQIMKECDNTADSDSFEGDNVGKL